MNKTYTIILVGTACLVSVGIGFALGEMTSSGASNTQEAQNSAYSNTPPSDNQGGPNNNPDANPAKPTAVTDYLQRCQAGAAQVQGDLFFRAKNFLPKDSDKKDTLEAALTEKAVRSSVTIDNIVVDTADPNTHNIDCTGQIEESDISGKDFDPISVHYNLMPESGGGDKASLLLKRLNGYLDIDPATTVVPGRIAEYAVAYAAQK